MGMIHCQNCTTRNSLNRDFCWKCGARLLVPSGPPVFDGAIPFMEEHVLERISALEFSITMLNKRVEAMAETVERLAASNFIDHTMIETLTDSLESAGIDLANLEAEWRKRIDSRIIETEEVDRLSARMRRIVEAYRGSERQQFGSWIEKSYDLLVEDRAPESIRFLKLALQADPANHEIGMVLAEVHFQNRQYSHALRYLGGVLETRPDHFEATFLIGLVQQRKGNLREAQFQFENAIGLKKDSAAAHASLGFLLAETGDRKKALQHLDAAIKLKPSAPVHFLLSAVYYNQGDPKRAIRHLRLATQLDPHFGEAFYQLGLLCLEMKWVKKAQECFKTAQSLNPRERRYRKRVRSFSDEATGPDQLNRLIREELCLVNHWAEKRTK